MSRKLVITDGIRERELQLVGRLVVGRDPSCDISDDHSLLSRRHAEFVTLGSSVTLRDLGSRNGVFVNGNRAAERVLEPGDLVQIGPLRARYVVDDAPINILPEALDGDRTAMLRKPDLAGPASATAMAAPAAASSASVLADTVVPQGRVDDDVTRMVAAPARQMDDTDPGSPSLDEEVTRFTPGPAAPELTAVLRGVPTPAPEPIADVAPRPLMAASDEGLRTFVLTRALLLALIAAGGTMVAGRIAPGILGVLLALVIAGGSAVLVAGIITGRVTNASGRDRS